MPSPVLAGPPGACCAKSFHYEGTAIGRTETFASIETYVSDQCASAGDNKKVLFFLSDIHGPFYINNQLLQDYFASQGLSVYLCSPGAIQF
jgi:hypothetical protein